MCALEGPVVARDHIEYLDIELAGMSAFGHETHVEDLVTDVSFPGGHCCKTPQKPCDYFPANRPNEPQSLTDVSSRPLPKSPVNSSQDNVVPQIIIRSPHVRARKFVLVGAKRVLQQYPGVKRTSRW
jgi:hypothetical protein